MGGGVLHGPSPRQLPGLRPMEEQAGLLSAHTHAHTHPHTHTAPGDPAAPPHSQETLSRTVVSRVTCAPWSVTRQVRLEPWSWGLGVRVSSGEWRVSGSISSRASPAQENRKGCRPAQTSDRLQVSCVGRLASRGSTNWMSGFSVGTGGDRGRCLDAGVWGPRGGPSEGPVPHGHSSAPVLALS